MSFIKILIVEDELIIAEDMKGMLQETGYQVTGIATDNNEAKEILTGDVPDIALIDINLSGGDDGILLARFIREQYDIPIVFITSLSDRKTVERAKQVRPEGYIVKPFMKEDLYTSIEIAIFNHAGAVKSSSIREKNGNENVVIRDSIFIRTDYKLVKIRFDDLIWIKSELNYLELHCRENKYLVRSTMREFVDNLPGDLFLQVHKSYCINLKHISAIDHRHIWLEKVQVPIGRSYLETVQKTLNLEI